jgi:type IV secretion system protein TrbL
MFASIIVTAAPSCDNILTCAVDNVGAVFNGAAGAVNTAVGFTDFWSDPAGNTFQALQDGARGLSDTVMPAITKATLPDLTADWFINSYKISFGIAIFVFIAVLIPQFIRTARGQQSGRDLAESLGLYAPLFLVGAAFGPAIGAVLVKFFGALSDSLISWGIDTSSASIVGKFSKMLDQGDKGVGLAGGAIIGIILMIFMIIGLLVVVLILIVQLITLYFSGVLFPLGLVWIVDPTKRSFGLKIGYLWFGILASHPLLFFMLAIAYQMISGSVDVFGTVPTLERTITLVVSILSLLLAGLSPLLLTKFAPVIPMGGSGTFSGGGATIGSHSLQDADSKLGDSGSPANSSSEESGTSSSSLTSGSSKSEGGGGEPKASSSISDATKGAAAGEEATADAGAAGAAAGGTTATGGVMAAEGSLATAGAAETATGVGAVVGIPTMIAAGAAMGASAAASAVQKTNAVVGEGAMAPIDDHEEHYGKDSTS